MRYLSIAGAKVALYFYSPNISDTFFTSFFDHNTHYPHNQKVTPKDFLAQFVVFGSPYPTTYVTGCESFYIIYIGIPFLQTEIRNLAIKKTSCSHLIYAHYSPFGHYNWYYRDGATTKFCAKNLLIRVIISIFAVRTIHFFRRKNE